MGTRRLSWGIALCMVALCALPATASAAMRKATGKTNQGKAVSAWIRGDNSVALVKFAFKAKCRDPGYYWTDKMYFRDRPEGPFERQGEAFSDGGKYKMKYKDGPATFVANMTGAPSPAGGWEGTFRISVRAYNRRGKMIDFCKTRPLTWKVALPES